MEYIAARHTKPVTKEEEKGIAARARAGDKRAQNRLILSHYRFAVTVAHKYHGQGCEVEDLISEGLIGLHRAAQSFDPEKGLRFMSYAVWWIRQSITKFIRENGTAIRLPSNFYVNGKRKQTEKHGARHMVEHKEAIRLMRSTASMEAMAASGMDFRHPGPGTDIAAENRSTREAIDAMLNQLDPRDQYIVRARYGLDTGEIQHLRDIGVDVGVSHERIRQRLESSEKQMRVIGKKVFATHR